jgi:SAM-dependent methyltransferase
MGCPPVAELAAAHTIARLRPVLPSPPARLAEVGAGCGALAAALRDLGYAVTVVEPDAESAAACRDRGLDVVEITVEELPPGGYDAVLCTRMLHHVPDLVGGVRRAAAACVPGGPLVVEDFARDEVDRAAAAFVYDARSVLAATGLLPREHLEVRADPLAQWQDVPPHLRPIHPGRAVLGALAAVGATEVSRTEMLWRMALSPAGGTPGELAPIAGTLRGIELRRIADGTLPAIGILAVCRPAGQEQDVSVSA